MLHGTVYNFVRNRRALIRTYYTTVLFTCQGNACVPLSLATLPQRYGAFPRTEKRSAARQQTVHHVPFAPRFALPNPQPQAAHDEQDEGRADRNPDSSHLTMFKLSAWQSAGTLDEGREQERHAHPPPCQQRGSVKLVLTHYARPKIVLTQGSVHYIMW